MVLHAARLRADAERSPRGGGALTVAAGLLAGTAVLVRPGDAVLPADRRALVHPPEALVAGARVLCVGGGGRACHGRCGTSATYGRFVLVASEGGVTFWTGNHPLAIGEGDLAANPAIKQAEVAFRQSHPGLTADELEPLYYRDALAQIAAHPGWWALLLVKKAFYTFVPVGPSYTLHSTRYLLASVIPYLAARTAGVHRPVPAGAPRRRRHPAAAPRAVGGDDRAHLFPAGTLQDSRDRSDDDHLCLGRNRRPRGQTGMNALVVVPTYNERDNLPLLVAGVLAHDGFGVLVVDDGSPDGTGAVADQLWPPHIRGGCR